VDNLRVDVTSEGRELLALVLALFGRRHAEGYKLDGKRFVLYWSLTSTAAVTPFPFKMTIPQLADFVLGWLSEADYGPEPDHDGDNGKGWRCYNEGWGHIGGEWQAFAAVEPVWAMYGK
jgi:hypothetical protein